MSLALVRRHVGVEHSDEDVIDVRRELGDPFIAPTHDARYPEIALNPGSPTRILFFSARSRSCRSSCSSIALAISRKLSVESASNAASETGTGRPSPSTALQAWRYARIRVSPTLRGS